ncbi:MAG TPA: hypothetical protein VER03_13240, partial [Bryobacteraceae bacterium]|nr:hypothetical protein [Bryobacteraceae bacterium]
DPARDRFFVLRQDRNEVLVFDASTYAQTATLRTLNQPRSMAITHDRRYLLVGSNLSAYLSVYDLETLELDRLVLTRDYVQSIATSANAILIATHPAGGGDNKIHRVDLGARVSTPLPTLGVFDNKISANTVLVGSGNGRYILVAQGDGNLMLYDAVADTFTVSRKESTPLVGAYAASNYDQFAVGNAILNNSLVPVRRWADSESGKSSGFAFLDNHIAFRLTAPDASAPGVLQRVDLAAMTGIKPTRTSEAGVLGETTNPFTRSLAILPNRSALVALTTSGITVFPWAFDEGAAPPRLDRIVNAADGTQPIAPGGLISLFGSDLSPVSQSSRQIPLPTILGESCLTVNGMPVPVMFVSPGQINAQLPFAVDGTTQIVLRTPGGVSDGFNVTILPAAPSIFRTSIAGHDARIATVVRSSNSLMVTPTNPIHRGDVLTIYATGLGRTNPAVESGVPSPAEPLASVLNTPTVTLGGVPMAVEFAGLTPGEVGVYQINVRIDARAPLGLDVPLNISQGSGGTTVSVRVVE